MKDSFRQKKHFVAPVRLSLIGGGTDVEPFSTEEGSRVLNFAFNKQVDFYVTLEKVIHAEHKKIQVEVINSSGVVDRDSEFVSGLESSLNQTFNEIPNAIKLQIQSPVPNGSGLGTSSTMVVGAVFAISSSLGISISREELIETAFNIERKKMKIIGGFQDYYPATYGGINLIQQLPGGRPTRSSFAITDSFLLELESRLFCFNLGVSRKGESILLDQVNRSRDVNSITRSALRYQLHLANSLIGAITDSDFETMLDVIDESFKHKKHFSPLISSPIIEKFESELAKRGARGIKVSGAGGGGHMFCFLPIDFDIEEDDYLNQLKRLDVRVSPKGATELINEHF